MNPDVRFREEEFSHLMNLQESLHADHLYNTNDNTVNFSFGHYYPTPPLLSQQLVHSPNLVSPVYSNPSSTCTQLPTLQPLIYPQPAPLNSIPVHLSSNSTLAVSDANTFENFGRFGPQLTQVQPNAIIPNQNHHFIGMSPPVQPLNFEETPYPISNYDTQSPTRSYFQLSGRVIDANDHVRGSRLLSPQLSTFPEEPSHSSRRTKEMRISSREDEIISHGHGHFLDFKERQGRRAHSDRAPEWLPNRSQKPVKSNLGDMLSTSESSSRPRLITRPSARRLSKSNAKVGDGESNWSALPPGQIHLLFPKASMVPRLDNLQLNISEVVMYLPRLPEYSGNDHIHRIIFRSGGMPGPYILDIAEEKAAINGEDDKAFAKYCWRTTKYRIDWPGYDFPVEGLRLTHPGGQPLLRGELANIIATRIAKFIINTRRGKLSAAPGHQKLEGVDTNWHINNVDVTKLRLISLNYYHTIWIPVLALDISAYQI